MWLNGDIILSARNSASSTLRPGESHQTVPTAELSGRPVGMVFPDVHCPEEPQVRFDFGGELSSAVGARPVKTWPFRCPAESSSFRDACSLLRHSKRGPTRPTSLGSSPAPDGQEVDQSAVFAEAEPAFVAHRSYATAADLTTPLDGHRLDVTA